jgi:3-isopropylmalate/(R)-2-methylmalate dehydratase small subunit
MKRIGTPLRSVAGRAVVVPGDDVDTDRIIPARFMKGVTFDGLGEKAFFDERFDEAGHGRGHPLDRPEHAGAAILVAGRNFGCGSSREHAPQALARFGFEGVVAVSFAEIFFGNSTTIGLVCAAVTEADRARIVEAVVRDPTLGVRIDVEGRRIVFGDDAVPAAFPEAAREALLSGNWDPLAILRARAADVAAVARQLPYAAWSGLAALLFTLALASPAGAAVKVRPATEDDLKIGERPLPTPAQYDPDHGRPLLQTCVARREGDPLVGPWSVSGCTPAAQAAVTAALDAWTWPLSAKDAPPPVVTFVLQHVPERPPGSYDAAPTPLPAERPARATSRPKPAFPVDALKAGTDATCVADLLVHPWGMTAVVAVWDCEERFQLATAKGLIPWEWTTRKATAPFPQTLVVGFDAPAVDAERIARKATRAAMAEATRSQPDAPPERKRRKGEPEPPPEARPPELVDEEAEEVDASAPAEEGSEVAPEPSPAEPPTP